MATFVRPVFLAPGIRYGTPLALTRAGVRPVGDAAALARGVGPRELLSFMLFLDTARCFGIEHVVGTDGRASPLGRILRSKGPLRPPKLVPEIGCVLIAQDEEERIATALASVRPFVHEIVVVDGGSRDNTVEIARTFDAIIVERPFDRDFGAQQNAGLERVRCPWTLVIDADEVLQPELGSLLLDVISNVDVDAVNVPFLNIIEGQEDAPVWWPDLHPRLFCTGLRYHGKVHCELGTHRRTVQLPISGPYMEHRKDMLRQHRASLLYSEIEPGQFSPGDLRWIRSEIERLTRAQDEAQTPAQTPGEPARGEQQTDPT